VTQLLIEADIRRSQDIEDKLDVNQNNSALQMITGDALWRMLLLYLTESFGFFCMDGYRTCDTGQYIKSSGVTSVIPPDMLMLQFLQLIRDQIGFLSPYKFLLPDELRRNSFYTHVSNYTRLLLCPTFPFDTMYAGINFPTINDYVDFITGGMISVWEPSGGWPGSQTITPYNKSLFDTETFLDDAIIFNQVLTQLAPYLMICPAQSLVETPPLQHSSFVKIINRVNTGGGLVDYAASVVLDIASMFPFISVAMAHDISSILNIYVRNDALPDLYKPSDSALLAYYGCTYSMNTQVQYETPPPDLITLGMDIFMSTSGQVNSRGGNYTESERDYTIQMCCGRGGGLLPSLVSSVTGLIGEVLTPNQLLNGVLGGLAGIPAGPGGMAMGALSGLFGNTHGSYLMSLLDQSDIDKITRVTSHRKQCRMLVEALSHRAKSSCPIRVGRSRNLRKRHVFHVKQKEGVGSD
jgi:hypothetical protein